MINKSSLLSSLEQHLLRQKQDFDKQYQAILESKNSDTKSSMGDKYETSREMAQGELDKLQLSMHHIQVHLAIVQQLNPNAAYQKIDLGALVSTESGIFLIAIPLGKWNIEDQTCFIISAQSPIGQQLVGKEAGDTFIFQNKPNKIFQVF